MTTDTSRIPNELRDIAERRIEDLLRRARRKYYETVRQTSLSGAFANGGHHPQWWAIHQEELSKSELHARARVVWSTYIEVLDRAGIRTIAGIMAEVLRLLPDRLRAEKNDIFAQDTMLLRQLGGSVTDDGLVKAEQEVLQDLQHDLELRAIQARALGTTTMAALSAPRYEASAAHWRKVQRYTAPPDPDWENAVKEAITALEALAKLVVADDNVTLGKALSRAPLRDVLHPSIVSQLQALWGYTNTEPGIRHAGTTAPAAIAADAQFAIDSCEAAIARILQVDAATQTG